MLGFPSVSLAAMYNIDIRINLPDSFSQFCFINIKLNIQKTGLATEKITVSTLTNKGRSNQRELECTVRSRTETMSERISISK